MHIMWYAGEMCKQLQTPHCTCLVYESNFRMNILCKVNFFSNACFLQFTTDVLDVIDRGQELHLPIQKKPSKHQYESWCQRSHSHVIPTIEHWQDQLISLRVGVMIKGSRLKGRTIIPFSSVDSTVIIILHTVTANTNL